MADLEQQEEQEQGLSDQHKTFTPEQIKKF